MSEALQAYCVKCKTKRDIAAPQPTYTANATPGTKGVCPVCGTTLFRMGATDAHASLPKPEPTPKAASAPGERASPKKRAKAASRKTSKSGTNKLRKTTTAKAAANRTAASKNGSKSVGTSEKKLPGTIQKLVIVESPAKARSVGQYLGRGYVVKASKGHVRDLLVSQLSVDVDNDFEPKYRVMNDKRDVVKDLRSAVESAREVYLATDPDREGEAIAWHLIAATEMDPQAVDIKRVVFHEITKPAVKEAFSHPREIDMNLVNAQQARRILDRLVGYNITELLWSKVRNRLSAGRVQSIAVRLIVDREREIEAFVSQEYWTLDAKLRKAGKQEKPFIARLVKIKADDVSFGSEGDVTPHLAVLEKSQFVVEDVKRGERQRKPSAPFTTSTLQQEASRRLRFTASRTMMIAQQLYEGIQIPDEGSVGLITYMRTDSLNVSPSAQQEAREWVTQRFGGAFVPEKAPIYRTRAKGAQEAHEAIRPTLVMREPETIRKALTPDQFKLYNLIWQRFVSSQMSNAVYNTLRVDVDAGLSVQDMPYHFRVNGSTIKFAGFLALYEDSRDEDVAVDEDEGRILPDLHAGELLNLIQLLPEQHFTQPPPRYTEASLVRTLEEYGIGRPSTYAPTVSVIQDREYVEKKDGRLIATDTGKIVNELLVAHFPDVMDYQFTARMEEQLDDVSEGKMQWRPMLGDFYAPFNQQLRTAHDTIEPVEQTEFIGRDCPVCGKPLIIRYGRFGKFIGCSDYPNCRHTEPWLDRMGILCPTCGKDHQGEIIRRQTRRGRTFYGCSRYPDCEFTSWKKPLSTPCPDCGGLLVEQNRTTAQCLNCGHTHQVGTLTEPDAQAV
ncbi:MAG: type I DNA topoisomerase [bacterium]|nr:type I DNA topoisomerase [bacterium]